MIWKTNWRLLAAVAVLVIIVIAGAFAVVQAPQLADVRGRLAADLLSRYLGEAVDVSGDVALTLGPTIDIAIQGVAPVAPSTAATPTATGVCRKATTASQWRLGSTPSRRRSASCRSYCS